MVNEHADTTKFPDKGMSYKYINDIAWDREGLLGTAGRVWLGGISGVEWDG